MRIVIDKHTMDISRDTEAAVSLVNPIFNEEGSYSVGVSIPATEGNLSKLNFLNRSDLQQRASKSMYASIWNGILAFYGTAEINGVSSDGIDYDFLTNEGAFYDQIKDVKLSDIITDYVHWPIVSVGAADPFVELYKSCTSDNGKYTACSIITAYEEKDDGSFSFRVKNNLAPDRNDFGTETPGRTTDGYSPFLYLHYVLTTIFSHFGIPLESNPFASGTLRRLVLLNNLIDGISNRKIEFKYLVPDCTVLELLKCVEDKFGCRFLIYMNKQSTRCIYLKDMHTKKPMYDWTNKLMSPLLPELNPAQRLKCSSGTSLEKAGAAFADYHNWMTEIDTFSKIPNTTDTVYVKVPGVFCRKYNTNAEVGLHVEVKSSGFFDYTASGETELLEVATEDECVPVFVRHYTPSGGLQEIPRYMPFFPCAEKRKEKAVDETTDTTEEPSNNECPIAFLFVMPDRSMMQDPIQPIFYVWGTTNYCGYKRDGSTWTFQDGPSLNWISSNGLFETYYKEHNSFYQEANQVFSCQLNLTEEDIAKLNWDEKILIKNQPYYVDKIEITLTATGIRVDNCTLRSCRM